MSDFKEKYSEYVSFTEDNLKKYNAFSEKMSGQKTLLDKRYAR